MNSGNLVLYSFIRANALSLNCHPSGTLREYPSTFCRRASNFKLNPKFKRVSSLTTLKLDVILLKGNGFKWTSVATVYDGKYGFSASDFLTISLAKSRDSLTLRVNIWISSRLS